MLAAKKKELGAEWIVFDGIDVAGSAPATTMPDGPILSGNSVLRRNRDAPRLLEQARERAAQKAQRGPGRFLLEEKRQRRREMSPRRRKPRARGAGVTTVVLLRLYIVGGAPNSVQAIANLETICREHLKEGYRLEVVDVLEHPRRALADGVLVTPSLAKLSPRPVASVVGNLNDRSKVLLALGVKGRGE